MSHCKQFNRVLVIGTGAIGSAYAYFLAQGGCEVTTLCRSNHGAVAANGIRMNFKHSPEKNTWFRPAHVIRNLTEASGIDFQYIVITTKTVDSAVVIRDLSTTLASVSCPIVLIQNGIGIEEPWRLAFPSSKIISGVVYLPCTQLSPGQVQINGPDLLELGIYPAGQSYPVSDAYLSKFGRTYLIDGGATVTLYADIQRQRWKKALINSVWNPIAALTLTTDAEFLGTHQDTYTLCKSLMIEVLKVAHAEGYTDLGESEIDEQLHRAILRRQTGTGIKMSMLVDIEFGRPMESEAILGNVVRKARALGVEVNGLQMLYLLINAREVHRRTSSSSPASRNQEP